MAAQLPRQHAPRWQPISCKMAELKLRQTKSVWRDQVFYDRRLTPATFLIGYAMADYMTRTDTLDRFHRTGKIVIFPSQSTLRRDTGLHADTVCEGIAQLIAHGHLVRLKRGNQFTGSNQYRVVVK